LIDEAIAEYKFCESPHKKGKWKAPSPLSARQIGKRLIPHHLTQKHQCRHNVKKPAPAFAPKIINRESILRKVRDKMNASGESFLSKDLQMVQEQYSKDGSDESYNIQINQGETGTLN